MQGKELEIQLLLEGIYQQHGYDLREYSINLIRNKIKQQLKKLKLRYISELIPLLLYDQTAFQTFLCTLSVNVTDFFRDDFFYNDFKRLVLPILKTYPFIRIWHAGCATGEEVYSVAIILHEAGLLERCQIYATDINKTSLAIAKKGRYPKYKFDDFERNYLAAGGQSKLGNYFKKTSREICILPTIQKSISFEQHNLTADTAFAHHNVIFCRNVLIYFNKTLQDRVLNLFEQSLENSGILCLGDKESIYHKSVTEKFKVRSDKSKIYQKHTPSCVLIGSR